MSSSRNVFVQGAGVLLTLCLLVTALPAHGQRLRIEVGGANFRPYPVAAPDPVLLSPESAESKEIRDEIRRTLQGGIELVRAVELLPPKGYLNPESETWTAPTFANWTNIGASGLIRTGISVTDAKATVTFRFYDVVAQRQVLTKTYERRKERAFRTVHQFLDELVEHLTGEKGIFGSKIAFVRRTKEGKAVYLSNIDGSDMTRVTDPSVLSLLPAWSADGQSLLLTSYLKSNPDLYRLDLKSGKMKWISNKRGLNTGGAMSPDGKSVALTLSVDGNTEIYTMGPTGGSLRRLTDSWGQDVSATWSPDSARIAFVSSRSGQPHIYTMQADGTGQTRITFQGTYNQEPDWSPRAGGKIAFTARDERLMYDIFLVDPATKEISRLTQDEGHKNESPSFSPDGQQIVFTSTRPPGRGKKLYVMDVDGRNQRRISRLPGDFETPAWGPRLGYD